MQILKNQTFEVLRTLSLCKMMSIYMLSTFYGLGIMIKYGLEKKVITFIKDGEEGELT